MNFAEKLAAAYLRLNGFFILPHFTVFSDNGHNHIDIIAIRPSGGEEILNDDPLPLDEDFFSALDETLGSCAKSKTLGMVAEVKTNTQKPKLRVGHVNYAKKFFGNSVSVVRLGFSDRKIQAGIAREKREIHINIRHTASWIRHRIRHMDKEAKSYTKSGSWNLSESFLADFLCLDQLELLKGHEVPGLGSRDSTKIDPGQAKEAQRICLANGQVRRRL